MQGSLLRMHARVRECLLACVLACSGGGGRGVLVMCVHDDAHAHALGTANRLPHSLVALTSYLQGQAKSWCACGRSLQEVPNDISFNSSDSGLAYDNGCMGNFPNSVEN